MAAIKGHKISDQFREKTRRRQTGAGNSFYGKKHTAETLKKISQHSIEFHTNWIQPLTAFQLLKKEMYSKGFKWCRKCQEFYLIANVHSGLCRHHQNESYKASYAENPEKI